MPQPREREVRRTRTGLVIVDHGSKLEEANRLLEEVAGMVARVSEGRFVAVEAAHMELAEPSIEKAFERCVRAGAEEVVVGLFFLSPGRHSTRDIPRMAAEAARRHPGLRFRVTQPLGLDERLIRVLLDRVESEGGQGPIP